MAKPMPAASYQALSSALGDLHGHYDAIVIGSGYGGAIAACRLAQARREDGSKLRIALLERGRETGPGSYPDTLLGFNAHAQYTTPAGRIGPEDGLFDFRLGGDVAVIQGCGLGGTSLINAGLAAEPLPWVLQDPAWPEAFRQDLPNWPSYLHSAKHMLQPAAYPASRPVPGKLAALRISAESLKLPCHNWPVNVTFEAQVNAAGVAMNACDSCGDCVTGCNRGAKNTVLFNYLPLARRHGAELFCQVGVEHLERRGERWVVHFRPIGQDREALTSDLPFVTADLVILGAGALGTAEILERSRQAGLPLSGRIGKQFSGNGDVLAFGYNTNVPICAVGSGSSEPNADFPPGPCITGVIDLRSEEQPKEHGMFIMDAVLPAAFAPAMPVMLEASASALGQDTDQGWADRARELGREAMMLVPGLRGDAIDYTQTYLVMCHDAGEGQLAYDSHGRASVVWPEAGSASYLGVVDDRLKQCTAALGGTHVPNPAWTPLLHNKLISCHPMGTCAMAERAEQGVVDHKGRVFAGETGHETHPGLYVTDASAIPRSLGVNPLLTISTVAERAMVHLLADLGLHRDDSLPPMPAAARHKLGLRFTERMSGHIGLGETVDWDEGFWQPETVKAQAEFVVTVQSDDLDEVLDQPEHRAQLTGTFTMPALSPEPMTLQSGEFQLFIEDPDDPTGKLMVYNFDALSEDGQLYCLRGEKLIHDGAGFDLVDDTTRLFATPYKGPVADNQVAGKGILLVRWHNLPAALASITVLHARDSKEKATALLRASRFFLGTLASEYL